jgi:hypothetical protein
MKQLPPDLTPTQLKAFEALERIRMAWIALWFVLALFSITLLSFLVALFVLQSDAMPKTILGAVNGLMGWAVKVVLAHLFPKPRGS